MRTRCVFVASLVLALVLLSMLADRRAAQHIVTGTIGDFEAGAWMSVFNQQTDPGGFRIALRETVFQGDPRALEPGVRVTVSYRSVGERRFVADTVRVLPVVATP